MCNCKFYIVCTFSFAWAHHMTDCTQVTQTAAKLISGQSNLEKTKSIQATAPELGQSGLWSPKSSTFSGSAYNVGDGTH